MAASQSCWRDRLLFGGIAISLLLHALVLFGGRTAAPAGAALPVGTDAPQRGRRLMGLLGGLTGGSTSSGGLLGGVTGGSTSSGGLLGTGLVDGLNVCGALGGLTACDASNGDFTVPGKLTITDGTRNIVIDPTTLTITTSAQRLNIGAVGNPHTLTTGAFKAPGAVNLGNTRIDGTATLSKAVYVNGILTARDNVNVAKTLAAATCTCAGKPASG